MDIELWIKQYKDNLGRMDLKPVSGGEASTNNQLLYTGELAILMKCMGIFNQQDFEELGQAVKTCHLSLYPGLYTRHPEPYRFQKDFRPVSFDEITGACFTNHFAGFKKANEMIYEHGKLNDWIFCDVPSYELKLEFKNIFKSGFFKDLKAYYYEAKTYRTLEEGFRKAVPNYPRFYPVFFKHNSANRLVYTVGSGRNPRLTTSLLFFLACFVASFKKDNISTKTIWFFRLKFLELIGKENVLTKLAKKLYIRKCKSQFGKDWEVELFKKYYKDESHPFHYMVKYARF